MVKDLPDDKNLDLRQFKAHADDKSRVEQMMNLDHMRKLASQSFPKQQILDSSKLKEFANHNFKFDENGRKFFKRVENTVVKGTRGP